MKALLKKYKESPPVSAFFVVVFLIFAAIMLLSTHERQSSFHNDQVYFGKKAAANARDVVLSSLSNRKRFIALFVEDNKKLIQRLADNPDNDQIFELIKKQLSRYVPDLFTINITNHKAELLIDDFEGFTGALCQNDILEFVGTGSQLIRVHPNHIIYHYDVLEEFKKENKEFIFFASFNLNELQSALKHASLEGHKLLLVRDVPDMLIEITEKGGRDAIKNRLDFRLTEDEESAVLSVTKVDGTHWSVIDMLDERLVEEFNSKLVFQNIIVFLVFTLLLVVVRYFIVSNILKKNQEILDLNASLQNLLLIDGLTGLYNKAHLESHLNKEWFRTLRDKHLLTVLLIDIDYFKRYNDNYGHLEGDKCLHQVAEVLQASFKRENDFVARFGGEEFCVVLNDKSAASPEELIESMHLRFKDKSIEHNFSVTAPYITVSVGVASVVPSHEDSPNKLLDRADKALYRAKELGRNRTEYSKGTIYSISNC